MVFIIIVLIIIHWHSINNTQQKNYKKRLTSRNVYILRFSISTLISWIIGAKYVIRYTREKIGSTYYCLDYDDSIVKLAIAFLNPFNSIGLKQGK